jgi:hypothetical protein
VQRVRQAGAHVDDVRQGAEAMSDLAAAGNQALVEALLLFDRDVYDPPRSDQTAAGNASRQVIEEIITTAGWLWEVPYRGDGQVEWCGLFAAAGDVLRQHVPHRHVGALRDVRREAPEPQASDRTVPADREPRQREHLAAVHADGR